MTKKVIDFNRLPKQEYQKPTMEVEHIQESEMLCALSQIKSTGLDDDLNFEGGSGDMDDAW